MSFKKKIAAFGLMAIFSSCSSMNRYALRQTSPLFDDASLEVNTESNWEFFRESTAANIKFLEGIWYADISNKKITEILIKAHAGYAFAVYETHLLENSLAGREIHQGSLAQANYHYHKSINYGFHYLKSRGINWTQISENNSDKELQTLLEKNLNKGDAVAIFYLAQSLGGAINLDKQDIELISYAAKMNVLRNWACTAKPDLELGVCDTFDAIYDISRPRMLGGDPARGRQKFEAIIKKQKRNHLAKLLLVQYYAIPTFDEEMYGEYKVALKVAQSKFVSEQKFPKSLQRTSDSKELNLFNAIAFKRLEIIEKYEKKIFD